MYKDKSPLNIAKKPVINDWHRADIIAAVRKTGTNMQELSRAHNFKARTLSNALYNPCPKYERLIAEHLDTTPQLIWPSRYNLDGTPKSGRGERAAQAAHINCDKINSAGSNHTRAKKSRNVYRINNRKSA